MVNDQYWDLFECRWVRYLGSREEQRSPAGGHVPLPAPRQQVDDLAADGSVAAVEGR